MSKDIVRHFTKTPAALFLVLFLVLLSPAILNGFPLVTWDSIAYSGQGVHWMRAKFPAVILTLPYAVAGYWASPIFNCAINAAAWLLLLRTFNLRPNIAALIGLVLASLQPLYASAVLVDAWFFPAIILLVSALRHPPLFVGALAGLLLSSHGSGAVLSLVFAVLAFGIVRTKRVAFSAMSAAIVAFGANVLLDATVNPETPRLAMTFPAARVFSVQPELLAREADRSGNPVLETAAKQVAKLKMLPENRNRRDLFWDVWKQSDGDFDLVAFENDHAIPILRDALTHKPMPLAVGIVQDFFSYYGPETRFDFQPVLTETFPSGFDSSRQAQGSFVAPSTEWIATAFRYTIYLAFIGGVFIGWKRISPETRRWVLVLALLALANDGLFAILSGPPDRYHHRILPLLAVATLLLISPRTDGAGAEQL